MRKKCCTEETYFQNKKMLLSGNFISHPKKCCSDEKMFRQGNFFGRKLPCQKNDKITKIYQQQKNDKIAENHQSQKSDKTRENY